jgi:cytochrome c-type biogenesis protein CcmH
VQKAARFPFLVLALAFCLGQPAAADPALEARVQALSAELRCLVCQNQTLADSNAPLAVDLRNQIREQMRAGASERDVIDFLVARYGDFVLYRPPFKPLTLLLWSGPLILLLAGLVLLLRRLRAGRAEPQAELSEEERARARMLLSGDADARRR